MPRTKTASRKRFAPYKVDSDTVATKVGKAAAGGKRVKQERFTKKKKRSGSVTLSTGKFMTAKDQLRVLPTESANGLERMALNSVLGAVDASEDALTVKIKLNSVPLHSLFRFDNADFCYLRFSSPQILGVHDAIHTVMSQKYPEITSMSRYEDMVSIKYKDTMDMKCHDPDALESLQSLKFNSASVTLAFSAWAYVNKKSGKRCFSMVACSPLSNVTIPDGCEWVKGGGDGCESEASDCNTIYAGTDDEAAQG